MTEKCAYCNSIAETYIEKNGKTVYLCGLHNAIRNLECKSR